MNEIDGTLRGKCIYRWLGNDSSPSIAWHFGWFDSGYFFSGKVYPYWGLSWFFFFFDMNPQCFEKLFFSFFHVSKTMTTGDPYRRGVALWVQPDHRSPPFAVLTKKKWSSTEILYCPIQLFSCFWNQPSRLYENRGRWVCIWLREVQINSVRVTQVADWVIETLKIG